MKATDLSYKSAKIVLSSHITKERLGWLLAFSLSGTGSGSLNKPLFCSFYLCGDALYSLFHPETAPIWREYSHRQDIRIITESEDLADMGLLSVTDWSEPVWKGNREVLFMKEENIPVSSAGFLHLYSPYMHRHTDQFLACVKEAVSLSVPVSVILYLDGVHLCHKNQVTTEFENIEKGLDNIQLDASRVGIPINITACQRCSQARGYYHPGIEDEPKATCFRKEVEISGLSQLIPSFSVSELVLSADCMDITGDGEEAYIVVITGTPYGTEHTFGALSFAVALAGKKILTYVFFVEDGAYCHIPAPDSRFRGTVRDIHGVIEATAIPGLLEYAVLEGSLTERGLIVNYQIPEFLVYGTQDVTSLMETLVSRGYHVRMLIW